MRTFELSDRARRSLANIADYSAENFGRRRADTYVRDLLARCRRIAAGDAHSHACRDAFGDDLAKDLRLTREGRHYVIFVIRVNVTMIVDFLHDREDIAAKLRKFET